MSVCESTKINMHIDIHSSFFARGLRCNVRKLAYNYDTIFLYFRKLNYRLKPLKSESHLT